MTAGYLNPPARRENSKPEGCAVKGISHKQVFVRVVDSTRHTSKIHKSQNDPTRNHLEGNTLYVSSIFKWHSEDFNNDIVAFIKKYAKGELKERLQNQKNQIRVEYLDYDWSLNGK
jgi:hypothetical protein